MTHSIAYSGNIRELKSQHTEAFFQKDGTGRTPATCFQLKKTTFVYTTNYPLPGLLEREAAFLSQ